MKSKITNTSVLEANFPSLLVSLGAAWEQKVLECGELRAVLNVTASAIEAENWEGLKASVALLR